MILVTFALKAESSDFRSRLDQKEREQVGDCEIISGLISGAAIAVFHTGAGPKSCASRMDKILTTIRPYAVISAGFAGSTSEELKPGDLIFAENFSNATLLAKARSALGPSQVTGVKLFTSPDIIDSPEERNEIARNHGAKAVDMESETIAKACAARAIPMLSLRVISDSSSNPFPVPPNILFNLERQRTDFGKLAGYFVRHPQAILSLLKFSGRISRARRTLTDALITIVQSF